MFFKISIRKKIQINLISSTAHPQSFMKIQTTVSEKIGKTWVGVSSCTMYVGTITFSILKKSMYPGFSRYRFEINSTQSGYFQQFIYKNSLKSAQQFKRNRQKTNANQISPIFLKKNPRSATVNLFEGVAT